MTGTLKCSAGRAGFGLSRLLLLVVLLSSAAASAAPADDKDKARILAQQAGDALDARDFERALALVTEAEALYHAPTNLMIAAEAQEGLGALVEAAEIYERIVAEPLPAGSPAAFKSAQSEAVGRVRALMARIPSLLVRVSPPTARAKVTLNGQPFEGNPDAAKRINPGTYTIGASAPGFTSYEKTFELERGGVVKIEIRLQREQAAGQPEPAPVATEAPPPATAIDASPGSKVPAYIAFGAGAVGLGVGAVTGKMSLDRVADLEDACPDKQCPAARQADIDDARLLGTVSTIGFGVGAAGVAAGVVLLITSGPTQANHSQRAGRTMQPWIGPSSLGLRGSF